MGARVSQVKKYLRPLFFTDPRARQSLPASLLGAGAGGLRQLRSFEALRDIAAVIILPGPRRLQRNKEVNALYQIV